MTPYQELEHLSELVRAGNFVALDKMLVLARPYMDPDECVEVAEYGLGPSEARIFGLLKAKRGKAVRRNALAEVCVHQNYGDPNPEVVDVHICRIRKKLPQDKYKIEAVWGVGYCLAA